MRRMFPDLAAPLCRLGRPVIDAPPLLCSGTGTGDASCRRPWPCKGVQGPACLVSANASITWWRRKPNGRLGAHGNIARLIREVPSALMNSLDGFRAWCLGQAIAGPSAHGAHRRDRRWHAHDPGDTWASSALPKGKMGSRRRPGPGCGRHWRAVSAPGGPTENGLEPRHAAAQSSGPRRWAGAPRYGIERGNACLTDRCPGGGPKRGARPGGVGAGLLAAVMAARPHAPTAVRGV